MSLYASRSTMLLLLATIIGPLDAARVNLADLAKTPKTPFVCPSFCLECCDSGSWFGGAGFKCVLYQTIGMGTQAKGGQEYKEYRETLKKQVEDEGYSCKLPERRKASMFQYKMKCKYKQDQDKPVGKCSQDTHCCCNEELDAPELQCIKPLEHQWFKWNNFNHDPSLTVDAQDVVAAVAKDAFEAGNMHILMGEREYRPAQIRAKNMQTYDQREGTCEEGMEYYQQPSHFGDAPYIATAGCCLETKMDTIYVRDHSTGMLNHSTGIHTSGKLLAGEYPVCKAFKKLRYCAEDEMYVEYVGKRVGVCFGDESTGASLSRFYGGTAESWDAVAHEARPLVKGKERPDGKLGKLQSCPTGWDLKRGGVRSCDCGGCGGVGAYFAAWASGI